MAIFNLEGASGLEFPAPDVCVVGSGAAGLMLGAELARAGSRVLILEAGGAELEATSQELYEGMVVGHPFKGLMQGRFRTYGGSTTKWGGQIMEFEAEDFAHRSWLPGSGWPISKDQLAPYYSRALAAEGLADVQQSDDAVWHKLLGAKPEVGEELALRFSRWMPETNFARLHRVILANNTNLALYLHATASRFILDPSGRRVVAVRCQTLQGKEVEFGANHFVLCVGAVESIRFLLQPFNPGPWSDNKLLGRHCHDRVGVCPATVRPRDWNDFMMKLANAWIAGLKYHPRIKLAGGVSGRDGLLATISDLVFLDDQEESLGRVKATAKHVLRGRLRLIQPDDLAHALLHLPVLARHAWHYWRTGRAYHQRGAEIYLGAQCEQEPLGASTIRLADKRDAIGMHQVVVDWRISDLELTSLVRHAQVVRAGFESSGLADVTLEPFVLADRDAMRERCSDVGPMMGGARMADDSGLGVVDRDLRLHGTDNAYVCSTAVFPNSGSSSPTHTLIALAIRLADELAARTARA